MSLRSLVSVTVASLLVTLVVPAVPQTSRTHTFVFSPESGFPTLRAVYEGGEGRWQARAHRDLTHDSKAEFEARPAEHRGTRYSDADQGVVSLKKGPVRYRSGVVALGDAAPLERLTFRYRREIYRPSDPIWSTRFEVYEKKDGSRWVRDLSPGLNDRPLILCYRPGEYHCSRPGARRFFKPFNQGNVLLYEHTTHSGVNTALPNLSVYLSGRIRRRNPNNMWAHVAGQSPSADQRIPSWRFRIKATGCCSPGYNQHLGDLVYEHKSPQIYNALETCRIEVDRSPQAWGDLEFEDWAIIMSRRASGDRTIVDLRYQFGGTWYAKICDLRRAGTVREWVQRVGILKVVPGNYADTRNAYVGNLDEMHIWDRALTEQEMEDLKSDASSADNLSFLISRCETDDPASCRPWIQTVRESSSSPTGPVLGVTVPPETGTEEEVVLDFLGNPQLQDQLRDVYGIRYEALFEETPTVRVILQQVEVGLGETVPVVGDVRALSDAAYSALEAVEVDAPPGADCEGPASICGLRFQLSPNGTDWYTYLPQQGWVGVPADRSSWQDSMSFATLSSRLADFGSRFPGRLAVRVHLRRQGTAIRSITITYQPPPSDT